MDTGQGYERMKCAHRNIEVMEAPTADPAVTWIMVLCRTCGRGMKLPQAEWRKLVPEVALAQIALSLEAYGRDVGQ